MGDRSVALSHVCRASLLALGLGASAAVASPPEAGPPERDLTELSLDELSELEVTTVARRPESRLRTPAAVHVITGEEIRRSGATRLVEVLRLAPGVQVSQTTANQWAFGIRGFPSVLSRAVLVMIDGRVVYTPLFAGTYWDVQDVLLEDVERIEIVRGPGGTLWGANAVNGIVNIVTKSARDTTGRYAGLSVGTEDRAIAEARVGGRLGARAHGRVYAKYADRDAAFHPDGADFDDWRMGQAGFRTDFEAGTGTATLQGDVYLGRAGRRTSFASYDAPFSRTVDDDAELSGGNVRAQWQRPLGAGDVLVEGYYDRTQRVEANFDEDRDTLDVEVQYHRGLPRQELLAGAGYRWSRGRTGGVETVVFRPRDRSDDLFEAFVQDEIHLVPDRFVLTAGVKVEQNDYSGFEVQPSGRLLWEPRPDQVLWAAVTRAVRTPSRLERDLELTAATAPDQPVFARLSGSPAFDSESVVAYELGYRLKASEHVLVDVTGFHNVYDGLLSLEPGAPFGESDARGRRTIVPLVFGNGVEGEASGVELSLDARPTTWWSLRASYSFLDVDLRAGPDSADTLQTATAGASPRHQVIGRTSFTRASVTLDAVLRYVSRLPAQQVPGYAELSARAAWRPRPALEVAAVGRNLLHDHHAEFEGGVEIERGVRLEVLWRF
jgi:iron complex outermembrane receptor protein